MTGEQLREFASKPKPPERRVARHIAGFEQPEMPPQAQPVRIEPTEPLPWAETKEPPSLKLRQYTGDFVLPPGNRQGGKVRTVNENDVEEFLEWGVPRFAEQYPDCTREAMLPFIRMAIQANTYKAVRTDNCFGLFNFTRLPWLPRGMVCDVAVVARKEDHPNQHKGVELIRVCRAGLEWATHLGASRFYLGADLAPIAKRLGMEVYGTLSHKGIP
jgi:hypothetical protein